MKIHMHLFCLIVALATGITDGRISSLSSSHPVGGSAMEVTPNQRELELALGTHYCTATDVGKQRGVVDLQDFDQCNKCEAGLTWWPCDDEDLCTGFCTPAAVCEERLLVAAAATETPAASDCATVMLLIESLREQLSHSGDKIDYYRSQISDPDTDNDLLRTTNDSLRGELEKLKAEKESLEESIVQKDATMSPTTSPTTSPTNSPTNSPLIIANKDEEFENPEEDKQNDSAYTIFFANINQLRTERDFKFYIFFRRHK